jgi:DNA transformation protein
MSVSTHFRDFVLEQLQPVGRITPKNMFGGVGLYHGAVFFAILHNDVLYFKVDESTRKDYEAEAMIPFAPYKNKTATLQYYEVPAQVLENRELLAEWAHQAIAVARKAKIPKATKRKKKSI